jgi:cold shock CspA family protein
MLGKIVYLNIEKRFGRIRENGGHREYFFHRWDVTPQLGFVNLLGEFVDFDARENEKGPTAIRIRPVKFL